MAATGHALIPLVRVLGVGMYAARTNTSAPGFCTANMYMKVGMYAARTNIGRNLLRHVCQIDI